MSDQNHGRSNKLPIEKNHFLFLFPKKSISFDLGCASVNRNSWRCNPESLGVNRSAYYP